MPMKKVAIVQSNYIPWKGYFDLIAAVDEFVLYDEAQFTKNDWRTAHFAEVARVFEPLYLQRSHSHLSALNREFIEVVCGYLGISTRISNCWDYDLIEGKTDRLV